MEIAIYRTHTGTFVLVPACVRPSQEAEHLYGPLTFHDRIDIQGKQAHRLCPRLELEFDRHTYAVISAREARDLLARSRTASITGVRKLQDDHSWT